jgi:hypothetical protein
MANQRIWRDTVEAPPPDSWTFVYIPFFRSGDDEDWYTQMYHWIRDHGVGEWAFRVRMTMSTYSDDDGQLYAFSDPTTAMEVKLRWG